MSTLNEIKNAKRVLMEFGCKDLIILHCNTEYPTPYQDVNLKAMNTIREELGVRVGYSDHTQGITVPIAAVALGAEVIEKHFTLNRNMIGPDHRASLEPDELKEMIRAIRNVEASLGDGVKKPSESEKKNIEIARKSIVAKCNIAKGTLLNGENLTTKRPGIGISPMECDYVIGQKAKRDFDMDEMIEL